MNLESCQQKCQHRVEHYLAQLLPEETTEPSPLASAMRYSVLSGGKRIRPLLVYLCNQLLDGESRNADPAACAVELMHAYSLIHDDLPAMDDDDLRRGQPTCHKQFDEATAILAGDALQSMAFSVLADPTYLPHATPDATIRLLQIPVLADACGARGMVLGQSMDCELTGSRVDIDQLEAIHHYKTGALIQASVRLGLLSAECTDAELFKQLACYAQAIGLAFQVQDDILDVTANPSLLGKPTGSDALHNKSTYVSILGLDEAKARAQTLCHQAQSAIAFLGDKAALLHELAQYIVNRHY